MTPEQRRDMIQVIDLRLIDGAGFVDRIVIPLLSEAERRGAEQALRDAERDMGKMATDRLLANGPADARGAAMWDAAQWLHDRAEVTP